MPTAQGPVQGVYEKNPGSGVWYVRYRKNGKLVRKSIGKKQAAVDYHRKVMVLLRSGEGFVPATAKDTPKTDRQLEKAQVATGGGITISTLCDDLLGHIAARPETYKDQKNPPLRIEAIRRKFGDRDAGSLRPYEISGWLDGLNRKPATLNRLKSTLSAIYRHGKHLDKIQVNPARDVKQRSVGGGVIRYLTANEETRLRDVLRLQQENEDDLWQYEESQVRHRVCELDVALGTGMRRGEQYGLTWENVDFENKEIVLRDTKNGTARVVVMIDDVLAAFKVLWELAKARNDGNAPESTYRVFAIEDPKKWWQTATRKANISNMRWHDLRHSLCSRLAQNGASLKIIQEAAGHKTIAMAARYAHLDQSNLRGAMAVLNRPKD